MNRSNSLKEIICKRYGGKKFSVAGTACIPSNEEDEAGGLWVQGHPQLLTKRLQKLDKDNDENADILDDHACEHYQ